MVEHFLGREEVVSSILTNGSSNGSVEKISGDGDDEDPIAIGCDSTDDDSSNNCWIHNKKTIIGKTQLKNR